MVVKEELVEGVEDPLNVNPAKLRPGQPKRIVLVRQNMDSAVTTAATAANQQHPANSSAANSTAGVTKPRPIILNSALLRKVVGFNVSFYFWSTQFSMDISEIISVCPFKKDTLH